MPSVMHSLGELEHIYDKQNLKLKTTGCITVSSPHVLESPYLAGLQDLDTLVSSKTWVPGGFRLQFQIRLIFEDIAVSSCNMSQAIEDLGIALCNAEVL